MFRSAKKSLKWRRVTFGIRNEIERWLSIQKLEQNDSKTSSQKNQQKIKNFSRDIHRMV